MHLRVFIIVRFTKIYLLVFDLYDIEKHFHRFFIDIHKLFVSATNLLKLF
jgi:hypothetical protein